LFPWCGVRGVQFSFASVGDIPVSISLPLSLSLCVCVCVCVPVPGTICITKGTTCDSLIQTPQLGDKGGGFEIGGGIEGTVDITKEECV